MKKLILFLSFCSLSANATQIAMFCGSAKESKDARMVELSILDEINTPMIYAYGHQVTDYKMNLANGEYIGTPKNPAPNSNPFKIAKCNFGKSSMLTLINNQPSHKIECICSVY